MGKMLNMGIDGFERKSVDFIGVGAGRSGSTWIYECLKEHPDICMHSEKEARFLLAENLKDTEQYNPYFSHCSGKEKIRGEFSPQYICSEAAAKNIKYFFPNAKLLVCVRNPIDRIESSINLKRTSGATKITGPAWKFIEKRPSLVDDSRYFKHLQKFLSRFPREQIYIAVFADIKKDPVTFIQDLYRFLGVRDDFVPQAVSRKINARILPGSPRLQHILLSARNIVAENATWKYGAPFLKAIGAHKLFTSLMKLNRWFGKKVWNPGQLKFNEKERAKLHEYLKSDIMQLEQLINRDLSFWK